jgi:hypothetical protein
VLLVDLLENNERALSARLHLERGCGPLLYFAGNTSQTAAAAAAETRGATASVGKGSGRFGGCDEFPIVLNAGLSYEPYSDTLVAATFGRGIYRLDNAKEALLNVRTCVSPHKSAQVAERSSAEHFPRSSEQEDACTCGRTHTAAILRAHGSNRRCSTVRHYGLP